MLKTFTSIFLSLVFVFVMATPLLAAGLELTFIGTVNTGGNRYSQWWYQSANPTFTGTATPNASVTVTVSEETQTTTADASGNWSITPTTATVGEHDVSISSEGDVYVFTLTIGSDGTTTTTQTSTTSSTPDDLPVSGAREVTLVLIAGAGALLVSGFALFKFAA